MLDRALTRLPLTELSELLRRRTLAALELVDATLAVIDEQNPRLNAFTTLVPAEDVRAAARAADDEIGRGQYRGPLHGIPVGIKDLLDTRGLRTTYGSGMFMDHVPTRDAFVVERLRDLGAINVGKTATHELGLGLSTNNHFFGATRNPWNPDHVPGGSSGGSAAAVAAGMVPMAIGTDGGGSIRIPASFCGVTGLKPTHGLISNRGELGGGDLSYAVSGPITRSVRDAALTAQLLAGFDPEYAYSRPGPAPDLVTELERSVRGLRVGVSADFLTAALDSEVRGAYERTVRALQRLGVEIVEISMPHHHRVLVGVAVVFGIEGQLHNEELFGDRPRLYGPQIEKLRAHMPKREVALCIRAQHDRQRITRDYQVAFLAADVLLSPTTPFAAPRIDRDEATYSNLVLPYTGAANLTGIPGVPIPAGRTASGLPIGMQILAPWGADGLALRVAHALEQSAPEHRVQPPA